MAVTLAKRRLLLDGERTETGERQELRSLYSGEVVGRAPRASADHARRAVDAAGRASGDTKEARRPPRGR